MSHVISISFTNYPQIDFSWNLPSPRLSIRTLLPRNSLGEFSSCLLIVLYVLIEARKCRWLGTRNNRMTSASELFYQRRSRLGRGAAGGDIANLDASVVGRSFIQSYHNRRHHHNRHDLEGCDDRARRSSTSVRDHRMPSTLSEHSSGRVEQLLSQSVSSNNVEIESLNRSGNNRLPGTVLLARARLLERLRGVSPSENRRNGIASPRLATRNERLGEAFRSAINFSTSEPERQHSGQHLSKNRPPGLTPESLGCLQSEVFSSLENHSENVDSPSLDCGICLENFMKGDELIRLPCGHRFHSACLDPWIRICGDCPFCRRDIIVSSKR
ncbi:hypothetical protein K2173_023882 [Erythroxylum novogranatense]|uniref:RING-type domain-containing protein n=1 Tax=Erythroxylum novogranatense TaxID=1862640 RepID=A0AAV8TPT6_9ROSI|nr:hypothetical protein K2173_023882 [Erythroxylum novogranatense]